MATLTVTTAADVVDANDGETSLREAIAEANTTTGADEIVFDAGLSSATLRLTQGEIEFRDTVRIDGDIDGDGTSWSAP